MKTNIATSGGLAKSGCQAMLTLAALLLTVAPTKCHAVPFGDPSGGGSETWDCVFSGAGEEGICFITFSNDFTFSGFELLAPIEAKINPGEPGGGRPGSGFTGRGSTSPGTNAVEVLWGAEPIQGSWTFDINGRFIGSFQRLVGSDTNAEGVSFVGTVNAGPTKLTMIGTQQEGQTSYNGIIAVPGGLAISKKSIPAISGDWYGYETVTGLSSLELFTLFSDSPFPGVFGLEGSGPDYTTSGVCLISGQGKIGFAVDKTMGTNVLLRATVGHYSNTTKAITTSTTGAIEPLSVAHFNATFVKPVP